MYGLYASNRVVVSRNRLIIFSDDVSEGDSIDEGTEYCEDCVEPRVGNSESAKEATSNDCSSNGVECSVGGVHHPQNTHTGFNSSTIAADSSNGVTNTRCCRYSCMRF
jgi:hypothetical protein